MWDVAKNAIVRELLEPPCVACGQVLRRPLQGAICGRCWDGIGSVAPPWCARCGDELPSWQTGGDLCARCLSHPPLYALARSAGRYEGPLREIIHAFKYNRRRLLAEPLGRMMHMAGGDALDGADAVIPVPLHPWRSVRRGFNQADDLARELGLPVWRVLRRRRFGPRQAGQSAGARRTNLDGAFALAYGWAMRTRLGLASLNNRSVVIVDDVLTTGATVDACASVLLDAGVSRVTVLTAARTVVSPRAMRKT